MIEVACNETGDVSNHETGKAAVWHAMDNGASVFLHRADGTFNFGDVTGGVNNVKMDVGEIGADAIKLVVGVDSADAKATGGVGVDDVGNERAYGGPGTVVDGEGVAELNGPGNAV